MRRGFTWGVALWLLAGPAHGLEPWGTSSPGVRLVELGDDAPEVDLRQTMLRDAEGAEYRVSSNGGVVINCRPGPDAEWRAVTGGVQDSGGTAIAGIIGERLVVVIPLREAYIWSIRCDEVWPAAPEVRVPPLDPRPRFELSAAWREPPVALPVRQSDRLFEMGGPVCMAGGVAVWCFDFDDPERGLYVAMEAADFAEIVDQAGLTEGLLSRLWDRLFGGVRDHLQLRWRVRSSRGLPDGTAAFVVERQYIGIGQNNGGTTGPLTVLWVVLRHPDGIWSVRFEGPPGVSSGTTHDFSILQHMSPIGGGTELYYDAAWRALWVGPVLNWQTSGIVSSGAEVRQFGLGYRVLPLDEPGSGYLDLTEAWGLATQCDERSVGSCSVGDATGLWLAGELRLRLTALDQANWGRALVIDDREALDLDGDGLSRAEEAALGTSDFDPDHDGDGAYDGAEVTLGGDPAVADGGWHPPVPEVFIPSPLFAEKYVPGLVAVGDVAEDTLGFSRASARLSARGPLCTLRDRMGCGACVDVDQVEVGRWCQTGLYPPQVSWDGALMVYRSVEGFGVLDFATGETHPWISLDRLRPLYADVLAGVDRVDYFDAYPIDADSLYLINKPGLFNHLSPTVRVTHVDGAGTPTVVFDLVDEACAHGVGTMRCEANPPGWRNVHPSGRAPFPANGQFALGYHAGSGRLMVGVGGSPESYIFGLHPTEPPVELLRSRLLRTLWRDSYARRFDADWGGVFPQSFIELPDGAFFTDLGLRGPRLERPIPTSWAPQLFPGHGLVFSGVFGDTVVDQRGVEWVRSGRAVRPGDTLYLAKDTQVAGQQVPGYMLYGIGPRGGANPLWLEPDAHLMGVTGMHVAADGRLCVADQHGARLLELGPDDAGVPTEPLRDAAGFAPVDCHYDPSGDLWVLLDGPPRVAPVGADGALGEAQPVEGVGRPAGLIDTPEGGYEVVLLDPEGTLRGVAYDADGVRAEFHNGVGVDDLGQPLILTAESAVHAVLRPDGTFVAVMAALGATAAEADRALVRLREPLLARPDGLTYPVAFIYPDDAHPAVAQVPGGEARDPWSGAPLEVGGAGAPDAGGSEPDAGVADAGAAADPTDDGGCGCGVDASGAPVGGWCLVVLLGLGRRRWWR